MGTDPSNSNHSSDRAATIHPITTHPSDRGPSPTQLNDGTNLGAITPQRLVVTVGEAAHMLNISRGLAYELVARGELQAIRLGRRIVIPRVVLEEMTGTALD
jgi:excisionase family DNA binding protein